jgi:hypothetical protein
VAKALQYIKCFWGEKSWLVAQEGNLSNGVLSEHIHVDKMEDIKSTTCLYCLFSLLPLPHIHLFLKKHK